MRRRSHAKSISCWFSEVMARSSAIAREVAGCRTPLLGINTGSLGFSHGGSFLRTDPGAVKHGLAWSIQF
jgi:hypothetical protein